MIDPYKNCGNVNAADLLGHASIRAVDHFYVAAPGLFDHAIGPFDPARPFEEIFNFNQVAILGEPEIARRVGVRAHTGAAIGKMSTLTWQSNIMR